MILADVAPVDIPLPSGASVTMRQVWSAGTATRRQAIIAYHRERALIEDLPVDVAQDLAAERGCDVLLADLIVAWTYDLPVSAVSMAQLPMQDTSLIYNTLRGLTDMLFGIKRAAVVEAPEGGMAADNPLNPDSPFDGTPG